MLGSAIGIDATFLFGAKGQYRNRITIQQRRCGPAMAEHGHEFFEIAAVPGWQDYDFPELRQAGLAKPK